MGVPAGLWVKFWWPAHVVQQVADDEVLYRTHNDVVGWERRSVKPPKPIIDLTQFPPIVTF